MRLTAIQKNKRNLAAYLRSQQEDSFRFLDLPLEVRTMVFKYLYQDTIINFTPERFTTPDAATNDPFSEICKPLQSLLASRSTYAEGRLIQASSIILRVTSAHVKLLAAVMPITYIMHLQKLSIKVYGFPTATDLAFPAQLLRRLRLVVFEVYCGILKRRNGRRLVDINCEDIDETLVRKTRQKAQGCIESVQRYMTDDQRRVVKFEVHSEHCHRTQGGVYPEKAKKKVYLAVVRARDWTIVEKKNNGERGLWG